jgi:hypothetical protein
MYRTTAEVHGQPPSAGAIARARSNVVSHSQVRIEELVRQLELEKLQRAEDQARR